MDRGPWLRHERERGASLNVVEPRTSLGERHRWGCHASEHAANRQADGRKNRNGAFWEERYHATATKADDHLHQCIVYIDLNRVRAGVAKHPREWEDSGYRELSQAA